ncbi:NAD(P)/FAD-dependent oxidoreductase [Synechococcus elongatus]|uniref:HI0933-like protein n=1 Tax=Synechococcus elongatus (strain ATCC 33912 / PCC 7942 / FACHB-805) TaxID=1140 RepID=Q31LH2_SYNE7|nr:NAD(P)/FAD-dependent oxidoreductase [Synechococcus elongatus]ABB58097.1 HI0933-like protein [Synechococcus elongatus PCC 7942 = FACHB-805]AJD57427.1 flavoprotein [Synechococcus elongatus UTEX 2973]MBD2586816.1 NAD(P)/FAD-dependent oxidoreductase [Synechococcus elongatus FACHB-242]MBD2687887.1 NAD(P)/FAD-dependent oxidoreductase [Synechococcus elongatus FACHB-1061]MBD2706402.1 NAD(P)/FAD-dependent oxidoreductase [Synechococcus elongatus PCC 7942 = FACHB-805]
MEDSLQIAIVGGGAAGFFAAIACAEANPHAHITIYEAGPEPLSKVRISGGGRCNVTHHCTEARQLIQAYPRGGRALLGPFSRFQPQDTIAWFEARGVRLKTEADGRMFPVSDRSSSIINCLLGEAERLGIQLRLREPIIGVERHADGFQLQLRAATVTVDRLLLATGSSPSGYRLATALGHDLIPPVPSLFTFTVLDASLRALAGISRDRVQATLQVGGDRLKETGPLLITHWGLSGPAVLKLSAFGARLLQQHRYSAELRINWLPDRSAEQVRLELQAMRSNESKRQLKNGRLADLPQRLWLYLLEQAGLPSDRRWGEVSNQQLTALWQTLTAGTYAIAGKGVFKEEFVTAGGVPLDSLNSQRMESKRCPGLFVAGELLNVDGITGGFNFQNAWTSGWIAGQALADHRSEAHLR